MANENRYYKTPFAQSGNKAEVPNTSLDGAVSYATGFGPDYELPQGAVDRKTIERNLFNGFNFAVTKNLKQYQENLFPTWIEDNGDGVAFSYPLGMIVNHNSKNYVSLEATNQEEPGTGDKWVLKAFNTNEILASAYGVGSDGADYSTELQEMFNAGNESTTFIIDSPHYSLSAAILINNGFKEVIHYPNSVVDWLGAGLLSTTALALFTINLDANGIRTNETVLTTTATEVLEGGEIFQATDPSGFSSGDILRVDKHICRIVRIDGNNIITDRTLPIPSMPAGSEMSKLLKPNIGSVFQGPTLINFAADNVTQVYGFGVIAALCYNVTVKQVYGLHNASRLAELFYCADSLLEDVYQYEPTDVAGGGQSYAARISNGNDNVARKIRSYKGRHNTDITFSHRNEVRDSIDYYGVEASFLTHFNGCRYNKFINCNLYECLFGVYLSDDNGDFENEWTDSFAFNSRAIYRPVDTSYFRRLNIVTNDPSRDVVVPRAAALPSTLNIYDSHFDLAGDFINVDSDYTVNMYGGSYKSTRQDGLFRGIASGTPGSPTTTGSAKFNFYNVQFPNISVGQGRNNKNAKLLFKNSVVSYSEQPFGEDCGDQRYVDCDITATNASPRYLLTVGSDNNCELVDCTLRDVELPFRYFLGFPATGTITFGGNKPLGSTSFAASNLLANMNWKTTGYAELPNTRTNDGSPADGTVVYLDSADPLLPIKRYRNAGVWVDFFATTSPTVTSDTDTTLGRTLNVGYLGIGRKDLPDLSVNADTLDISGSIQYLTSGSTNLPLGQGDGFVHVVGNNALSNVTQTFFKQGQNRSYIRSSNSGIFTNWDEFLLTTSPTAGTQKSFIDFGTFTLTREAVNTYINRFSAGSATYTLDASTFLQGDMVYVSKLFTQVGTLTITTTSGGIFLSNGSALATQTLESVGTVRLLFDGTNWLASAA
jgi:hypothetical protein